MAVRLQPLPIEHLAQFCSVPHMNFAVLRPFRSHLPAYRTQPSAAYCVTSVRFSAWLPEVCGHKVLRQSSWNCRGLHPHHGCRNIQQCCFGNMWTVVVRVAVQQRHTTAVLGRCGQCATVMPQGHHCLRCRLRVNMTIESSSTFHPLKRLYYLAVSYTHLTLPTNREV